MSMHQRELLQYLKETMTLRLKYGPDVEQHKTSYNEPGLMGYADSDYTNDTKSKKLTMGYIYYLNEVAVSWSRKRAKTVAVSLTKAEYIALSNALK